MVYLVSIAQFSIKLYFTVNAVNFIIAWLV